MLNPLFTTLQVPDHHDEENQQYSELYGLTGWHNPHGHPHQFGQLIGIILENHGKL